MSLILNTVKWIDLHPHTRRIKRHTKRLEKSMPSKKRGISKLIAKPRNDPN